MDTPFSLVAHPPRLLTDREECALLERAVALRETPAVRVKLAQLHNRLDEFSEAIALLDPSGEPADYVTAKTLVAALLGRGTRKDLELALAASRIAEALTDSDTSRADALTDRARILLKAGDGTQALDVLAAALDLDPSNGDAFALLAGRWLARGEPDRALVLCDTIEAKGAGHIQLLGIRTQALAQGGDILAARDVAGVERFLSQSVPPAPDGWADLPSFHAAIAQELLDSPGIREGRHGTASIASLRVDEPATATAPAMRALRQLIIDHVRKTIAALPDGDHPWLRIRPAEAHIEMWCVITGAEGYERWHMHPKGWASGGYYVAVPETVQRGNSTAGCLEFGLPDMQIGREAAAAFGSRLLRPQPGLLNLFPSHAYHRTHPHGVEDGRRICVAFDLIPH